MLECNRCRMVIDANLKKLETLLEKHPTKPIYVRQFGDGAKESGKQKGITVIIDVFRASNTIIELLEAGAKVKPVEKLEEGLKFRDYVKVGEKNGIKADGYDFDNSPVTVRQHSDIFKDRLTIIRSTNGTRGIINSIGSKYIFVGSFRNLTSIVNLCYKFALEGIPISIIAMGSLDVSRVEDTYCAKMIFFKLVEKFDDPESIELVHSKRNPWNFDWVLEIVTKRRFSEYNEKDRRYSLKLDRTDIIPYYNQETGFLENFNYEILNK